MDLHRLRVVGFDTTVREKEGEKKHIEEHENRIKEEKKTSTIGNKDGNGDENQCLNDNGDPLGSSKKCLEAEISPPGTSKKYLEETSTPAGAIKVCVNDERTPSRTSKQCSNGKLHPPGKSKKYQNETTSTSQLGTPKTQRSKSEIFKIPSKKNPRKRALKINSSDTGLTKLFQTSAYSHRKKRSLNLRNKSIHARIRHKAEKEKTEEVHFLFAREKPSFIRDHKKRTDSERMKKKRVSKFPNDMYGFQISNRSLNQFQCQMSHLNFIDTDKIPFKKFRIGFHRKTKPPQPVTNCFCKYHAMRVLNSACGRCESRPIYYNLGTHPYPRRYQQKYRRDQEEALRRERSHFMAKDEIVEVTPSSFSPVPKSFHDACTGPSNVELAAGSHHRPHSLLEKSSTVQNVTIASEYEQKPCPLPSAPSPSAACAVPTDRQLCELNKSQTFQDVTNVCNQNPRTPSDSPSPCTLCAARAAPAKNKCKKKRKKKKKPFLIVTICNRILSSLEKVVTDFHLRNNMSRKSCIKYVIFGMLIVVWSPCLLAVILAWVVMFPWKLSNILKTDVTTKRSFATNHSFKRFRKTNLRREYQQMCFESCTRIPEKRNFTTLAGSWYSRTVGVVVNSFKAVMSLLKLNKKKMPTRAGTLFLPSSHPNPQKRYKLFYADNRGWVMKPLRRRTRSCTSNRVVQSMRCEFRPKFWQKLRCQNLQQASFRKVPCQVHGIDSYPMHQYSPAGDAYPVQSRTPWPTCTCREKYSQRPSTFTTLNSHHRLQQEVNIPLAFYYTTSGIAPISAGETVNPKLTNAKIKNNIALTNLAKDHHGHSKNGTVPLGVVPDGLTKHDAGNTLTKAPGVEIITTLAEVSNNIPCCVHRLRRQTNQREIPLNRLSARSDKLTIGNKSSPKRVNKINFSNKCVLTDTFTSTKQTNTRTHKVNSAHKTQIISKPMHHKVTNKLKMAKTIADMASKCACEVKFHPPKQVYTYKTDKNRTPAQKHPSPAKIKSSTRQIIVNYSFENKRKQSRQAYKYKPGLVSTHMQSNTAKITTMTNRHVALNNLCGKEHEKCQYGSEHKPHQISAATQKQLCTTDITTSTNRNVALNYSRVEDHGLFERGDKQKLHQIPVATQMQSRTADNATSTKHNVAMNFPCEEEHKLSKYGNQPKPHQIPVATQMQLKTTDIATCTNCNVATNCPYKKKHKLSEQGYKHKPYQILVASQMQSRIAENATDMNRDLGLIRPSEEKYKLSRHSFKHKLPVVTQMQQKTVDNATGTNRDLALNYSGGVKMSTANKEKSSITNNYDKETKYIQEMNLSDSDYQYLPGQIPVATQMQSNSADIATITNCDIAMNYPYDGKRAQSEQPYKYESDHIFVGTQKQPSTADIITSAKYLGSVTQSTSDKIIPQTCLLRASEKSSICIQKTKPSDYLSKADVSIQKHSYKIDASTDYVSNYERRKTKDNFVLEQTMSLNKTVDVIGATTSWEKQALKTTSMGGGGSRKLNGSCMYKDTQTIAYSALKGEIDNERPMRALSKEIDDCGIRQLLQTEELLTQFEPHAKSPLFGVASDSRYGLAPQITQTSKDSYLPNSQQFIIATDYVCGVTHIQSKPNYKMEQITAYNTNTHKTSSAREPPNKQSQLQEAPSHTVGVQEEPKLFRIASDCTCGKNHSNVVKSGSDKNNSIQQSNVPKESRQYGSEKTPVANTQGLKPDSVSAQLRKPSKTRTATESSPNSNDIQEIPCDCKCECNSVPRVKYKISHHLPSAQPGISKKDKTSSKSPKLPVHLQTKSSQKSSPQVFKQMKDQSNHTLIHKTDSAKEPHSKQLNLTQPPAPSRTAQEQSKFVLASDCKCGTDQTNAVEKNVYNNVSDTKTTTAKERKSNSPPRSSKHVLTRKTDSAKEHLSKQANSIPPPAPSRTVEEDSKFIMASDCKCGANQTTAVGKSLYNNVTDTKPTTARERESNSPPQSSKHVFTHKTDSAKEHLSKQANLIPPPAPSRTVEEQSKFIIASDCKCGTNQTTAVGESLYNNVIDTKSTTAKERKSHSPARISKNVHTHKTDSAKEPPSKRTNLIQSPSPTVQEQSKFVLASDCKCGTNQTNAVEKNVYNNVSDTKTTTAKERKSNSPPRSSKHVLTRKTDSAKEHLSKQANSIPPPAPSRTVEEGSKFIMASDCKCGANQTTAVGKSLYNNVTDTKPTTARERESNSPPQSSKHVFTHKTDSAKEHLSKQANLIPPPAPSRLVEEQSKFIIASDCKCGTNQTTAVGESLYNNVIDTKSTTAKERKSHSPSRISKYVLTHKTDSAKEPPSQQTNLIQPPSRTAQEQSKLVIASDCKCGTNQTTAVGKSFYSNVTDSKSTTAKERKSNSPPRSSKHVLTRKTDSAKELPSKPPNLIQPPPRSRTAQEQSKLVIAADCKCGTNQTKSTIAKERKSNSPPPLKSPISKFPKSLEHSSLRKLLPRKCRCHDSVGEQPYGSKDSATSTERNIVKAKTSIRSQPPKTLPRKCRCSIESLLDSEGKPPYGTKFSKPISKKSVVRVVRTLKLSGHMPPHEYLQQKCPCTVVGLQDPVPKQSPSIKVTRTLSKGNSVKVDKNKPKFAKSSKPAPPQEYLHLDCTCLVKNSQDPTGKITGKITSQSSRKSIFRRNSKSKSFDIPGECPCSVPQNDLHKISHKSDVPVNWNTTKRSFIWPRGSHCSVNESSSRVQSSSLSQYSTKVSSLVMSLSSKLYSRKNKTLKIPENTTKKTLSLQVKSKKSDREVHDDDSNQSLFRRSHMSKTQNNINQHSKTSEHSSIITLFTRMSNKKEKKSAKKFDPQYSSTLINCQPTPTVRQTVKPQLPQSPRLLKSKKSSILMRSQSKLFLDKIRPLAYKILRNSLKDQQEKRSPSPSSKCTCFPENLHQKPIVSEQSFQPRTTQPNIPKIESFHRSYPPKLLTVKKESEVSPQQLNAKQVIPIISGSCRCEEELKITKEHLSHHKQFEMIPQPPKPKEVIPIISESCRCEEELKITKEHLSHHKQFEVIPQPHKPKEVIPIISGSCRCEEGLKITKEHLSNNTQFEMIPQPSKPKEVIPIISGRCTCAGQQNNTIEKLHPIIKLPALGNEKQPESSQHLANQTLKSPAFKLSQLHASLQTDTPHNVPISNFRSAHKKPCKCRSFKHGKEQELSKSLHKVVNNKRSQEKLHNSHLISHVCNCSAATRRLREHVVHSCEIFQSPGVQASPLVQIYQQNQPDQKGLSKIPSNVDKPPPELLQQHPPGLGRQSTAERAVQQPYPDFDQVSMRYPGYKSPPKQSLEIGINGLPPAKNYPPAPGATPTPHYGFDPCYIGPPKICVPMVPYDETALRRAYKRRPLRYTPPRQQLPRVIMTKKLKENKQRAAEVKRRKGIQRATNFFKCLRGLVSKTEREVFPEEVVCNPMWLNALTRKPCFCIYKLCPRAYPGFLSCYNSLRYLCQLLVYFITLCFWSPLLLCGYLCCNVCCKCC